MPDNALQAAVVDIPIGSLNQTPPDHGGPSGRLIQLYDAVITHYEQGGQKRNLVDPRPGFVSLSNVLRNVRSANTEAGTWASPTFLFALGDQLLSVCSSQPRVWNGIDWSNYGGAGTTLYPANRVVTQRLSEAVLHTSNNTLAACDHAWMLGTTCSVWVEQSFGLTGALNTAVWVGFRADDGAWIRVPNLLRSALGADPDFCMAKVITDGVNFWVVYNTGTSELPFFAVNAYDQHGVFLASANIGRNWLTAPGYWDIAPANAGGCLLAQPKTYTATQADIHVNVKKLTYATGTITTALDVDRTDIHCTGPVAWMTNDLSGALYYLATVGVGPFLPETWLWAYELNTSLVMTHEYNMAEFPVGLPDSLTGWTVDSGTRDVFVSYSMLADSQSAGPTFDPARRFTKTVSCTRGGTTNVVRQTNSVIQQSRAFAIDGEYYAYTYYQSGSGQSLPSAPQTVTWTSGDYFVGAKEQPLSPTSGFVTGAAFSPALNPAGIFPKTAMSTKNIDGAGTPDSVAQISASGFAAQGIPDGTLILKWTFKNATFGATDAGSLLQVNSSSISSANHQWDIIVNGGGSTITYTPLISRSGGTVVPGNFTTTGTVQVVATVYYPIANIADLIAPGAVTLFTGGGTITISGASNGGNNGTFGLNRISLTPLAGVYLGVWTLLSTQVFEDPTAAAATITPAVPREWSLAGTGGFTAIDQQSSLNVSNDDAEPVNNGVFAITATSGSTVTTGNADAAATVAQFFTTPFPTFTLTLNDDSTQYTLKLASVTFDYTYIGALVSIVNAAHTSVDGIFKITALIDSHTVRVTPTNGANGQRSESFVNTIAIVIQRATNVQPETQPIWFVTPLSGQQAQVGAFERGLAFADWRFDGETSASPDLDGQNRYRFHLSSTSFINGVIRQVVLPFRATNFTQVSIATVGATPIDIANTATASTVGLKIFQSQGRGEGTGDAGKLLLPGLLAGEFTTSGFSENNFNVGPEAPFIVSEAHDGSTNFALTPGQTYTYQVTVAEQLENGDVVESSPSPPIQVTLTGTNNVVNIGGRLLKPLDTIGNPVAATFGVTNHRQVTYKIFRSVVINGVPSTTLHLITNPGAPNAPYPGGSASGFSFPDSITWNYRDENPDAGIQATEVIYAGTLGQGIAPHFGAPPFRHATTWANRRWVVGYDGAVWMSAELQDGEDVWFFPGFRYPFPAEDPAVCVVGFENFLFMFCAKSVWRIPLAELPNATLTSGAMPSPVRLPFAMGCSGFAVAAGDAVAYSSSVNGGEQVWAITRNLANVYLSEPVEDQFLGAVTNMAVDGNQRLLVTQAGTANLILVYDPVPREWSSWRMPSGIDILTAYQGEPTYEDDGFVLQQSDAAFVDTRNGVSNFVAIDLTLSSLTFAAVRAVKRLWEAQIMGTHNGDMNINAVISYPFSYGQSPTTFGPTAVPAFGDMLLAINPAIEDAGEFVIRIFGSFEGAVTPQRCFSLEMLSCEVGLDGRQGLKKLPDGFRLVGR